MPSDNARHLTPYQQKLLDPRWQKMRLSILERDKWACRECGDESTTLHVHHYYYLPHTDPWDYPIDDLGTLCADCHQEESEKRPAIEQALLQVLREAQVSWLTLDCFGEQLRNFQRIGRLKYFIQFFARFIDPKDLGLLEKEFAEFEAAVTYLDTDGEVRLPALTRVKRRGRRDKPESLEDGDWLKELLTTYAENFDFTALNDSKWWADTGNSFENFSKDWVQLSFASLARWLRDNPRRRPRTPRGWKERMNFSLNWYYDKHARRTS